MDRRMWIRTVVPSGPDLHQVAQLVGQPDGAVPPVSAPVPVVAGVAERPVIGLSMTARSVISHSTAVRSGQSRVRTSPLSRCAATASAASFVHAAERWVPRVFVHRMDECQRAAVGWVRRCRSPRSGLHHHRVGPDAQQPGGVDRSLLE